MESTSKVEITRTVEAVPAAQHYGPVGLMDLAQVLKIAAEGITRNKVRSLLTMLGVIIGGAAVIVMISISAGTEATIAEQIEGLGANLAFIQASFGRGGPRGFESEPALVYDDVSRVADVRGVVATSVEMPSIQSVRANGSTLSDINILGTSPDFPSVRDVDIVEGRYFNDTEVNRSSKIAVLGSGLAAELFGDNEAVGQSITVGNTKLTVIGVAGLKGVVGNSDFDFQMYVPIKLVFDKFVPSQFARFLGDRVNLIYAQVDEEVEMADVITQIQLKLANSKDLPIEELPFNIRTQDDIIETQGEATEAFRNLLAWVAGVSLLVGGIGIMNIMLVSVTERTREIGIRQSVGATPNDIRLQFLAESLMLSLIGGLIGILVGVGGAVLFGASGDMRTVIVPGSIVLAFLSAAAVGIFFGFFPANKAAQLDPIEALRHE